jgi:hypothetical protein
MRRNEGVETSNRRDRTTVLEGHSLDTNKLIEVNYYANKKNDKGAIRIFD